MEDHEIKQLPAAIETRGRLLSDLMDAALVLQWLRPPVHHMDKSGGGSRPLVSNPTADIALDTGRLKLRTAVLSTGRELAAIEARLDSLRQRMETALREYES